MVSGSSCEGPDGLVSLSTGPITSIGAGAFSISINVHNCTEEDRVLKVQGGCVGWATYQSCSVELGTATGVTKNKNTTITWNLTLPAGATETIVINQTYSKLPSTNPLPLNGAWSAAFLDDYRQGDFLAKLKAGSSPFPPG
ncbi:MAG: hypothetical protein M3R04_03785 [bacterium]|nr:hypothetical protein [bacterium]